MARDRLTEVDVCPYVAGDDGAASSGAAAAQSTECRAVELESLDLLNLAPFLLLLAAQEKAQEILADAQAQVEQIHADAAVQGLALGREEARQDLLPALAAFASAGQTLLAFEARMIERYTPQLVRLALEIAEKIIGKSVVNDPQITTSILARAEREVGEAKRLRIYLHPADYSALAEFAAELVQIGSQRGRQIEVVAAQDIGRGGCRLETDIGTVDATVPVQLAEIRRQLLDEEPVAFSADGAGSAQSV
jgi:flagellar biosynthesis/type III secretory pathway protein FliH